MDITEKQIEYYYTVDGRAPSLECVNSLRDVRAVHAIYARLARIRKGNFGDCYAVGEDVSELRIHLSPGYRIYFAQVGIKLSFFSAPVLREHSREIS